VTRTTTPPFRRLALTGCAGVALFCGTACGRSSPAQEYDAGPAVDADTDGAAVADSGPPDAALQVVPAWLAHSFDIPSRVGGRSLEAIAEANAAGDPPEGLLLFILRIEELPDNSARITWGIGEPDPSGAEGRYRYRSAPPPQQAVLPDKSEADGGFRRYTGALVDAPVTLPLTPGGSDPPGDFVAVPCPTLNIQSTLLRIPSTGPQLYLYDRCLSSESACHVWVNGQNLLDTLDGLPTQGLYGATTGSVDFATCAYWGPEQEPWNLQLLGMWNFTPVELVLE